MSKRYSQVCDRCGREIKYTGWTAIIANVYKKDLGIKVRKLFNGNPSGYDYWDYGYSLCAECTKELEEFLGGAK